MEQKGNPDSSFLVVSEEQSDCFGPMFLGVSCAFFALKLLPDPGTSDENCLEARTRMLQRSAHILGLLMWSVQRKKATSENPELLLNLQNARREIEELKKRRSEDAKANEKVVGIFAAQEQAWFSERKKLRQQIGALMNELRVFEEKKDKVISELNGKLQEKETQLLSKDRNLEEEEHRKWNLEEKLKEAEKIAEELRDTLKRDTQLHSAEISKHKTAFIELVSNQRQLEAEMGRALRQVEAAKEELDSVLQQKDHSVLMTKKLSLELICLHKDLEQKDQILSAMLRKSKLDSAERQSLLREVTPSKSKKKQIHIETEKWKAVSQTRHERHPLRSLFSKHIISKIDALSEDKEGRSVATLPSNTQKKRSQQMGHHIEYNPSNILREPEIFSSISDQHVAERSEMSEAAVKHMDGWAGTESEKYKVAIEKRHHVEIDAFAEQLRLKDEKLEALRWRLLSMELESKRLQSHIEGLEHNRSQLRQDNLRLESLLLNREAELQSMKEQLLLHSTHPNCQKIDAIAYSDDLALANDPVWSKVKIIKRKPGEKEVEAKTIATFQEVNNEREEKAQDSNRHKDIILTLHPSQRDIKGGKHMRHIHEEYIISEDAETSSSGKNIIKDKNNYPWMDLHALGVSYKIKRLKQQLLILERLTGEQESCETSQRNDNGTSKTGGIHSLMVLLNKQVGRYQSLQRKIDELCKRMHDNHLDEKSEDSDVAIRKKDTKILQHFLEETFQLQRYMVATGQKLMEVQARFSSEFVCASEEIEHPATFDMKRFAESIRTLFREAQRGLEVRIARIIGDLEGTLACDGITHM